MHLLPQDMQASTAGIDIATDDANRRNTLRLCTAYNSKVGVKNMVLDLANAVRRDVIKSDDISPFLIAGWLAIMEAPETELWFRSSGEVRFSEFLVLQSGYSYIHTEPEHWLALGFRNWVWAILRYQISWPHIKNSH
ncbi:dehydrodolichyl diphosphate synthase complex subunit DHDDS-like [Dermacentor variabilis]|uniref:dehydrodolichyl diphosphate synthase complex subunit DHDDS-like n=1 Tax=Dermacentor variabilis TaxID=34621 RepID=UPI003F5BF9C6